jgi:hypothetical protein
VSALINREHIDDDILTLLIWLQPLIPLSWGKGTVTTEVWALYHYFKETAN